MITTLRSSLEALGQVRSKRVSSQVLLSGLLALMLIFAGLFLLVVGFDVWISYPWVYPLLLLLTYVISVLVSSYGRVHYTWIEVGKAFFRLSTLAKLTVFLAFVTGLVAFITDLVWRLLG